MATSTKIFIIYWHRHHVEELSFRKVTAFAAVHTARKWKRQHRVRFARLAWTPPLLMPAAFWHMVLRNVHGVGVEAPMTLFCP